MTPLKPNLGIRSRLGRVDPSKLLASAGWITSSREDRGADASSGARRTAAVIPGGGALAIAILGVALGLGATELVVARGWDPGTVAIGPWMVRPQAGTVSIDPYARADLARSGELTLAASEGLLFTATIDDTGYRLVTNCVYSLAGPLPAARFWTLTASVANDRRMADPDRRSAFTSTEVVRDLDGRYTVAIASTARPGNWLPVSGDGPFSLALRLYDTPLAGSSGEVASASVPSITRRSCSTPGSGAAATGEIAR